MKKVILLLLVSLTSIAGENVEWKIAKINEYKVLESWPVQYEMHFEKDCRATEVRPIKFVQGNEVVLGVAQKVVVNAACTFDLPPVYEDITSILGDYDDPMRVKLLK